MMLLAGWAQSRRLMSLLWSFLQMWIRLMFGALRRLASSKHVPSKRTSLSGLDSFHWTGRTPDNVNSVRVVQDSL